MKVVKLEKEGKAQLVVSMDDDEALEVCAAIMCGCMCRQHIAKAITAIRGIRKGGVNKSAMKVFKSPVGRLVVETIMLVDEGKL